MAVSEILARVVTIERTLESRIEGSRLLRDQELRFRGEAQRELHSLKERSGGEHPDIKPLEQAIAAASSNMARANESMTQLVSVLEPYRETSKSVLPLAKTTVDKIASVALPSIEIAFEGDSRRPALDALREQVARVDVEIDAILEAPMPAADAAANVVRALNAERQIARTQLSYFAFPAPRSVSERRVKALAFTSADKTPTVSLGLLDLLLPGGELEKRLIKFFQAEELAGGKTLPLDARPPMLARLRKQRTELLEREEVATLELEAKGLAVVRRRDVDPALLLRVWESIA
jgi:hypothetical protein